MVKAGLPVMGHIGLTPQSAPALGGYKVQGKTADAAKKLVEDAIALQEAGVWGMLVECVPPETMALIHEAVDVICMSLGAGPDADGQLVIVHDMIGYLAAFHPKFAPKYVDLTEILDGAFKQSADRRREVEGLPAARALLRDDKGRAREAGDRYGQM